jgi:hypothetical protein
MPSISDLMAQNAQRVETAPWPKAQVIDWRDKINPLWWFGNVEGMDPNYEPGWPLWQRRLFWFFRNFAYNFFRFVVGVEDRDLMVTGPAPVFTPVWLEASPPRTGWKWAIIRTGWVALPFVSYTGNHVLWYAGWLPSGGRLGAKFNLIG